MGNPEKPNFGENFDFWRLWCFWDAQNAFCGSLEYIWKTSNFFSLFTTSWPFKPDTFEGFLYNLFETFGRWCVGILALKLCNVLRRNSIIFECFRPRADTFQIFWIEYWYFSNVSDKILILFECFGTKWNTCQIFWSEIWYFPIVLGTNMKLF